MFACFLQKNRGTVKCYSNDFSDGYTNVHPEIKSVSGAASTLQMIRFQLDKIYPNPDYDLNMSTSLGDNCKDVSRAFYDFINNADAKFDRSVTSYLFKNGSLNLYLYSNVILKQHHIMKLCKYLFVLIYYTPSYSQMLCVVLYDETVRLTYDNEKCIATDLVL